MAGWLHHEVDKHLYITHDASFPLKLPQMLTRMLNHCCLSAVGYKIKGMVLIKKIK